MTSETPVARPVPLVWVAFFVAAGLLGFEISLMRVLLVASWHHFAFLVITIALLGFGTSGSVLLVSRRWVLPRAQPVLLACVLITAAAMPLCVGIAQHIPVEARIVPALVWRQLGCWLLFWVLLSIPFFIGAGGLGLTLMVAESSGQGIARVYAANLLGSAVGAILAPAVMTIVEPRWLSLLMAAIVLIGGVRLSTRSRATRLAAWTMCVAVVATYLAVSPPAIRVDPYKYGAYVARLESQGTAKRLAREFGPRAVVEAFASEAFHDLPFLSVGATPAAITVMVADGHLAGSILDRREGDAEETHPGRIMTQTIMSFPYALAPPRPRVLLLGETGGIDVWLAKEYEAKSVQVVQPDANILSMLRGPLGERSGQVLELPGVATSAAEPRQFIERTSERFDLIQLAMLQSSSAGSGGVRGLGQEHLVTVEGITACLERLTNQGLLTVSRGIQSPPRDNLKLLATFIAALERAGAVTPARHVVVVRDYLAVCTMVKATLWTPQQIEQVRRTFAERQLTPVWFPGIRTDELNHPDMMPGPPGEPGDWYHYAATRLFSADAADFIDDWHFDIRPPRDNRPFFFDFCKLASIGELQRAFGDLWLTRAELAFMFVVAVIVVVAVAGAVLTLLPLVVLRTEGKVIGKAATVAYFTAIGIGYLLLEMTFLSRLTRWIGEPVTAAAVTIAGFLFFSGIGSLMARRSVADPVRRIRLVVTILIAVGLLELLASGRLAQAMGTAPLVIRCGIALMTIAPLGILMGFPMPMALVRLDRGAATLVPWAWGVNGFASVLATPLAMAIGMTWGFNTAGAIALALYAVPGFMFARLPGRC